MSTYYFPGRLDWCTQDYKEEGDLAGGMVTISQGIGNHPILVSYAWVNNDSTCRVNIVEALRAMDRDNYPNDKDATLADFTYDYEKAITLTDEIDAVILANEYEPGQTDSIYELRDSDNTIDGNDWNILLDAPVEATLNDHESIINWISEWFMSNGQAIFAE